MSGGGGGVSTSTPYTGDLSQLSTFMTTASAAPYRDLYNPDNGYVQIGDSIQSYNAKGGGFGPGGPMGMQTVGPQVNAMIDAYHAWVSGNNQTQANWQSYANQANAVEGGEGDNTITTGPGVSQRNALLGALANAGNPTVPTGGLGSMGTLMANGKPVPPGGGR